MRFLLDQPISRLVGRALRDAGHDAVHVSEYGLSSAKDEVILDRAGTEKRTIITQDTDFGTLLSAVRSFHPSIVLFRLRSGQPYIQISLLLRCLPEIKDHLQRGAVVVITESMIRIRRLPIT